uniref:40S ribosomal protein S21-like n=1 Tax=Jaculus jaculus TaxID=51337 RepID=UPI001E1B3C02|nr:40S ribosomal protein S21-like [Jaculus jaculus]
MRKDTREFVDLHVLWKCSASNRIVGAKGPRVLDKVTGRFNGQFKNYTICGMCRMGESDDATLQLAKADGIVSKSL